MSGSARYLYLPLEYSKKFSSILALQWIIFLLSTTYLVKIMLQNEKIAR
jgi:hypothetical protein